MNARFRLAADLEIALEVEQNGSRIVKFSIMKGVCHGHGREQICDDVKVESYYLPKNEARAIASAMMGCAAEV